MYEDDKREDLLPFESGRAGMLTVGVGGCNGDCADGVGGVCNTEAPTASKAHTAPAATALSTVSASVSSIF